MDLVDRDRLAQPMPIHASAHPLVVVPLERARRRRDGCRGRAVLEPRPVRIALEPELAAVAHRDLVLVELARAELGDEQLPDARGAAHAHRMVAPIPMVERADDADALGVRRPDREAHPRHVADAPRMRAEESVSVEVVACAEALEVRRIELRRKAIRVVVLVPEIALRLPADSVRQRQRVARADPLEQSRARDALELGVRVQELGALRIRQQHAHDHLVGAERVGAEHEPRVVQSTGEQPLDVGMTRVGERIAGVLERRHQPLPITNSPLDTQCPSVVALESDETDFAPTFGQSAHA